MFSPSLIVAAYSVYVYLFSSGELAVCDASIFGSEIRITGVIADQQASMFGHCNFSPGDAKITLGTGSFLDVNTGSAPLASITGQFSSLHIGHCLTRVNFLFAQLIEFFKRQTVDFLFPVTLDICACRFIISLFQY